MTEEKIYIFGSHSRARTLAVYLRYLQPGTVVEAYLYDNEEPNPGMSDNIPVLYLPAEKQLHTEYAVYIATRGIYHPHITAHLKKAGFGKIIPVTVELDLRLRNAYLAKYFEKAGREYVKIDSLECPGESAGTAVYVVRSVYDRPLRDNYEPAGYEKQIPAGASLTKQMIPGCAIRDNTGDHISEKNRQFCELTALYWIWKNATEKIVGLAHYRRHFILPDDWSRRMLEHKVDVILPVPLYVGPSLSENFKSRHDQADWNCMMEYLKKRDLQEYKEAELFFSKNLYSPCNMFIMRKNVLDRLCEWLFPLLFSVAESGGIREDAYANRYPGFLSERLITFYFEKYRNQYKIVYADKNFLA